jgi:hypothetical protein
MENGLFYAGIDVAGDDVIINLITVQQILKSDRNPFYISFKFATHRCDILYETKTERDRVFCILQHELYRNRWF